MEESQIKITVNNFRAIEKAEINIDGITVVTGENGCGKSTLSNSCIIHLRQLLNMINWFIRNYLFH